MLCLRARFMPLYTYVFTFEFPCHVISGWSRILARSVVMILFFAPCLICFFYLWRVCFSACIWWGGFFRNGLRVRLYFQMCIDDFQKTFRSMFITFQIIILLRCNFSLEIRWIVLRKNKCFNWKTQLWDYLYRYLYNAFIILCLLRFDLCYLLFLIIMGIIHPRLEF